MEFDGLRLPFGCCVSYIPSPTKDLPHGKWDPVMHVGIFAGYKARADWHWRKGYYVRGASGFAGVGLPEGLGILF